jgi:hypothetical protein
MPKKPEPLKPLIPLEDLKKVVARQIAVPKLEVTGKGTSPGTGK